MNGYSHMFEKWSWFVQISEKTCIGHFGRLKVEMVGCGMQVQHEGGGILRIFLEQLHQRGLLTI